MTELLLNEDTYLKFVKEEISTAKKFVWIATADLKDIHVDGPGKKYVPFVGVLAELVRNGVDVRLIHAKEPGPHFREDFDKYPELTDSDRFEQVLCPRMHMKCIIVDGRIAYLGSANLTGAGMGAKSPKRRNFECGVKTDEASLLEPLMTFYDSFWMGGDCPACGRREYCPGPLA
jgi:phosphatidylserine/phosphatidylglycerophosphate/cardiolipin synthase-like enzyme